MNLLSDLDQAIRVLNCCKETPVEQKARMNFIINLVTILELFSREVFRNSPDGSSLDCDSLPLSIILHVVGTKEEKDLVSELVQLRNEIVHEGRSTNLADGEIIIFYTFVKKVISQSNNYQQTL